MTDKKMLIGSLSNDLYRVASLTQRGSIQAANRFFAESQRWSNKLADHDLEKYIEKIISNLNSNNKIALDEAQAEKILMYSVLLQNYALHLKE